MNSKQHTSSKPWYKEPWPWLLMAGPAIVVVAGLTTYYIANTHGDTLVSDDYYKEGKNIELQLGRDQEAVNRHIRAQILVSPGSDQAKVFISGKFNPQETIKLLWLHPTQKQWDQAVTLKRDEGVPMSGDKVTYSAAFKPLHPSNHWYVRVEDEKQQWRVQEKWLVSQGNSLDLQPMHQEMLPQKKD